MYIWGCFTGFLQPLSTRDRSFLWFDTGRKEETSTLHGSDWVDRFCLLIGNKPKFLLKIYKNYLCFEEIQVFAHLLTLLIKASN